MNRIFTISLISLVLLMAGTPLLAEKSHQVDWTERIADHQPNAADLSFLKKFYKKAHTWGLYGRMKKLSGADYNKLLELYEKFDLDTQYLLIAKEMTQKKPKPKMKVRRQLNRGTIWYSELQSFLIKHQAIDYVPKKGAKRTATGVDFQF